MPGATRMPTTAGRLAIAALVALVQMLVHDLFKISQRAYRPVVIEWKQLHQHDSCDVPARVNPELRVEKARPAQAPRAAVIRVAVLFRSNLKPEPRCFSPSQ